MNLLDYAKSKGLLKSRTATVVELKDNGVDFTLLYKIEGQRYPNNQPSAKSLSREVAKTIEVDKDSGKILSGKILKKSNFWIWVPSEESENEA